MILEKGYCRLEHSGLVHFSIVNRHHRAELVDQQVELVPSLFFTEITSPPKAKIFYILTYIQLLSDA